MATPQPVPVTTHFNKAHCECPPASFARKSSWNDAFCSRCGLSATRHFFEASKSRGRSAFDIWSRHASKSGILRFWSPRLRPSPTLNVWRRTAECGRSILVSQHDGDHALGDRRISRVGRVVPAIIGRRLHQGFARSRSIRRRDWRENQSNRRPKLGPGWQSLGQR